MGILSQIEGKHIKMATRKAKAAAIENRILPGI